MNIAFDPWIPVITMKGKRKLVSLCAVFTNGQELFDLAVRPHERVSLMRLFLCVAHAALDGPKDYDEWCDVPKRLPGAAKTYLRFWANKECFELFHPERPWLQIAKLVGVEKKGGKTGRTTPVALLDFELATGNNSTLFDHGGLASYRPIEPERIALNLLTFHNFSPGGGSPVAQWKTKNTSQVGNPDAPCLSQSMAHCLLRGSSITETISFNLTHYENISQAYRTYSTQKRNETTLIDVPFGRPVWERFPDEPDIETDRVINATRTYLGRLVPISRWIRVIEGSDQMFCSNGFKYPTYKDGFAAEPTACVRIMKKKDKNGKETSERKVVSIYPNRATWRELPALLIKRHADGIGGPLSMETVPSDVAIDFHVCAVIRDQASMDISTESTFSISSAFKLNIASYRSEVEYAENLSFKLRKAIETYRLEIDNDWSPRINRTQAKNQLALKNRLAQTSLLSYWTNVEKKLSLLFAHIEAIGSDDAMPTRKAWHKMLYISACDSFCHACGQTTPRQLRAFAKGWQVLTINQSANRSGNPSTKGDES